MTTSRVLKFREAIYLESVQTIAMLEDAIKAYEAMAEVARVLADQMEAARDLADQMDREVARELSTKTTKPGRWRGLS